ncbi:MAG: hypothetical protein RLZZ399_2741 [Verrucomicrobiota bacterium]|jgi:hypothetical protein
MRALRVIRHALLNRSSGDGRVFAPMSDEGVDGAFTEGASEPMCLRRAHEAPSARNRGGHPPLGTRGKSEGFLVEILLRGSA